MAKKKDFSSAFGITDDVYIESDLKTEEPKEASEALAEKNSEVPPALKVSAISKKADSDFDIEMDAPMDEADEADEEGDATLAGLFQADELPSADDEQTEPVEVKASTGKKAGITRLGGQPKVASAVGDKDELGSLWTSAPDVSEAFK